MNKNSRGRGGGSSDIKMEDNNEGGKVVEIDTDLYEYLAILGMKLGQDNVNDFINDVLLFQLKKNVKTGNRKGNNRRVLSEQKSAGPN